MSAKLQKRGQLVITFTVVLLLVAPLATSQAAQAGAPVVDAGPDQSGLEGDPIWWSGSFSDSDSSSWAATVDYGDGSGVQPLVLDGSGFDLEHRYADNGEYTVTVSVADDEGATGSDTVLVTVHNVDPLIYFPGKTTINEGDFYDRSGQVIDAGADTWTGTVDFVDGSPIEFFDIPPSGDFGLRHQYLDDGTFHMVIRVTDDDGGLAISGRTAFVVNLAPKVQSVDVSVSPVAAGSPVVVDASFTDAGVLDDHTASIDWGDGHTDPAPVTEADGSGTASSEHVYTSPGTYTVTVTVVDDAGDVGTAVTQIVVGDPNSSASATGGGWILVDGSKANFGFQASSTSASLEGQATYDAAGLHLKSMVVDSLVRVDGLVSIAGSARVDGAPGYTFVLFAEDGGRADRFGITIRDSSGNVVHRSSPGSTMGTTLGGGQITIRAGKR